MCFCFDKEQKGVWGTVASKSAPLHPPALNCFFISTALGIYTVTQQNS